MSVTIVEKPELQLCPPAGITLCELPDFGRNVFMPALCVVVR